MASVAAYWGISSRGLGRGAKSLGRKRPGLECVCQRGMGQLMEVQPQECSSDSQAAGESHTLVLSEVVK